LIIFAHSKGPYKSGTGIHVVPVVSDANSPPANGQPGEASHRPAVARNSWRRLAPRFLKLWGGFGRQAVRLANGFSPWQVDLLHTNNTGCEESAVAARMARIPGILGTFHVDSTYDLEKKRSGSAHRVLECLSNRCLHQAIAVSQATKRDWVRRTHLAADRVVVIPNGIDPQRFGRRCDRATARRRLGLKDDGQLIIGGVGRLDQAKGFCYLLEALARLAVHYPAATVVLAGQGALRPVLAEQAARLGIADRVNWLGFCADVQAVYDALDIFVMPSLCEALPYALLEAMATGLPAVGTRVGGIPEVIVPGVTGLLVPPREPISLAEAIRPLLDSEDLRHRMGQAGRERVVHHFNEIDTVQQTIRVYREMLKRLAAGKSNR
jgi:glycosyltransferase involved in cell wall biosynthesis